MALRTLALMTTLVLSSLACRDGTGPRSGGDRIDDAPGAIAWTQVSAGTYNSCAVDAASRTFCWGFALVSNCSESGCEADSLPAPLESTLVFDTIGSGGGFHCGIARDGSAWCWGEAMGGTLGDGDTERSRVPVRVDLAPPVRELAVGYAHVCALTNDGAAWCWGRGGAGSLGSAVTEAARPTPVSTTLRFTSISAGTTQTCAVATTSIGYCWGSGYGSLGAGARDTSCGNIQSCLSTPVPLRG